MGGRLTERERSCRAHHPGIAQVAEHVHGGGGEMGRANAAGDDQHSLSAFAQTQRRREPREARADDDGVVSHAGTCSTSRMPWKIQSSSLA